MVEGAGLGDQDGTRTPSLAPTITRHADDEAHGLPTMLAEAVPECQTACAKARAAWPRKISISMRL